MIHQSYVNAWDARAGNIVHGCALHREGGYARYLDWLKENTRLKLKVAMVGHQIEDLPSDPEDVFDEYDEVTRKGTQPERGPLQDYIVSYFQVFFIGPLNFYEYFLGCITHCCYY
ncbi:hypothetical protein HU200_048271 [Digitaria exilis]|uniref:Uncharacterized protein n=1 Tax=Digitaria exilis TaxID=1010633 RepID=A0A835B6S1_9POAL|nr:hypothetical protein HU200_048271 [Digitaria exilis]